MRLKKQGHEFVKSPLPFQNSSSHIRPKPARNAGDDRPRLRNVNAGARKPNEDAANMPSGWERQAEGKIP
jgi:hypothetical protein